MRSASWPVLAAAVEQARGAACPPGVAMVIAHDAGQSIHIQPTSINGRSSRRELAAI